MSEFNAKFINTSRYYQLRRFIFLNHILSGIACGFIAGGLVNGPNWVLIITGAVIYTGYAYFTYKKVREFNNLYENLPTLLIHEKELKLAENDPVKKIPIKAGDHLHFQVRTTSLRERITDYFRRDYADRSANFLILNSQRYDFIIDSHFKLRKLLKLFPVWEQIGVKLSWDFEKAFAAEMEIAGLTVEKKPD